MPSNPRGFKPRAAAAALPAYQLRENSGGLHAFDEFRERKLPKAVIRIRASFEFARDGFWSENSAEKDREHAFVPKQAQIENH